MASQNVRIYFLNINEICTNLKLFVKQVRFLSLLARLLSKLSQCVCVYMCEKCPFFTKSRRIPLEFHRCFQFVVQIQYKHCPITVYQNVPISKATENETQNPSINSQSQRHTGETVIANNNRTVSNRLK